MASLVAQAQLNEFINSTQSIIPFTSVDRLWASGVQYDTAITEDTFQSSTHFTSLENVEECVGAHVQNTKFLTSTTYSLNGGAPAALPIPLSQCALRYTFTHDVPVTITAGQFWVYNGIDDLVPPTTFDIRAAEGGVSTSWVQVVGKNTPLNLAPRLTLAATHNFYIALSMSPTNPGEKTAKFKVVLTWDLP